MHIEFIIIIILVSVAVIGGLIYRFIKTRKKKRLQKAAAEFRAKAEAEIRELKRMYDKVRSDFKKAYTNSKDNSRGRQSRRRIKRHHKKFVSSWLDIPEKIQSVDRIVLYLGSVRRNHNVFQGYLQWDGPDRYF